MRGAGKDVRRGEPQNRTRHVAKSYRFRETKRATVTRERECIALLDFSRSRNRPRVWLTFSGDAAAGNTGEARDADAGEEMNDVNFAQATCAGECALPITTATGFHHAACGSIRTKVR